MKKLYSTLIAVSTIVLFAAPALADPGTPWDKQIGSNRFVVLNDFGDDAVFDKETGRVWDRSPDTNTLNWFSALGRCYNRDVGGRKGWRLPTVEELASLVDTTQSVPRLPAGHPFLNVQFSSFFYWSATTNAANTSTAWGVNFGVGFVDNLDKNSGRFVWCVRGGQGIDGVQ